MDKKEKSIKEIIQCVKCFRFYEEYKHKKDVCPYRKPEETFSGHDWVVNHTSEDFYFITREDLAKMLKVPVDKLRIV